MNISVILYSSVVTNIHINLVHSNIIQVESNTVKEIEQHDVKGSLHCFKHSARYHMARTQGAK